MPSSRDKLPIDTSPGPHRYSKYLNNKAWRDWYFGGLDPVNRRKMQRLIDPMILRAIAENPWPAAASLNDLAGLAGVDGKADPEKAAAITEQMMLEEALIGLRQKFQRAIMGNDDWPVEAAASSHRQKPGCGSKQDIDPPNYFLIGNSVLDPAYISRDITIWFERVS
jgi:hypothetical protein